MQGERAKTDSGWTVDTLREHVLRIFEEHTTAHKAEHVAAALAVRAALAAGEKAIEKSDAATARRFESVNEFRSALADATANQVGRAEAAARFEAIEEKTAVAGERNGDRIQELELAAKNALTLTAWERYLERQATREQEERRMRTTIGVGVLLALFSAMVSVVLVLVR